MIKILKTIEAKNEADKQANKQFTRKPYLKLNNEDKFAFLDLGQLMHIVIYGQNWDNIFKDIFQNKESFQRILKDIMVLRNPTSHGCSFDDQDVLDGTAGLLWLSNCIGDPDLNPYA